MVFRFDHGPKPESFVVGETDTGTKDPPLQTSHLSVFPSSVRSLDTFKKSLRNYSSPGPRQSKLKENEWKDRPTVSGPTFGTVPGSDHPVIQNKGESGEITFRECRSFRKKRE